MTSTPSVPTNPSDKINDINGQQTALPVLLIPAVITVITGIIVGVGTYYLTKEMDSNIRSGQFEKSMSPSAREQYKDKASEINQNIKSLNTAVESGSTTSEKQIRQKLSTQFKELATIVDNDYINIVKNNPSMSDTAKALVKGYNETSKNILKQKGVLNQLTDSGEATPNTVALNTEAGVVNKDQQKADAIQTSLASNNITPDNPEYNKLFATIAVGALGKESATDVVNCIPGVDAATANKLVSDASKEQQLQPA
jgi:hypothetical protein